MAHLVEKGYECVDYGAGEGKRWTTRTGAEGGEALVRGEIDRAS